MTSDVRRLRDFVRGMADLLDAGLPEPALLARGGALLGSLVAHDDWLPEACARPHPDHYQQYLLHCDSRERFSIVSFVWGPGQSTPIHDHTVWGLVGVLRGAEISQSYALAGSVPAARGPAKRLQAGEVELLSPALGDIHRVWNASADACAVSIHVYGANIGAVERSVFAPDGTVKRFVSGYANSALPNIWRGPSPSLEHFE